MLNARFAPTFVPALTQQCFDKYREVDLPEDVSSGFDNFYGHHGGVEFMTTARHGKGDKMISDGRQLPLAFY